MEAVLQFAQRSFLNGFLHALFIVSFPAVCYLFYSRYFTVALPSGVALIREPANTRSFSLKTRLQYFTDCEEIYKEAYYNYTKRGRAVIVPGIGCRYEVLLPGCSMNWALAQPESILGVYEAFVEMDQVYYSLGHTKYVGDAYQAKLVRSEMNSVLGNIVAAMEDELQVAFDTHFGVDEDNWTSIDLQDKVRLIVAQAASRFTVGLPLCRNREYLQAALDAVDGFVLNAGLTFGTPPALRPIIGRICSMKTKSAQRRITKHFKPIYEARLAKLTSAKHDQRGAEPRDHLQLILRYAQRERKEELHNLDDMSRRLTAANLGSMHLTTIQVTNMLLNIVGSDSEYNTISELRSEVKRVLGENASWSKSLISKMVLADSVARETMRCDSFGGRSIFRKVMVDNVKTDTGVDLPKGTIISFLGRPAQMDEEYYEDASKFNPFRFSRGTNDADANSQEKKRRAFVTTSPDFLPFGHGKHSCPGRFLVDFELKMIVAYVVQNYELSFPEEYAGKRPPNKWVAEASFPPKAVKLMVKRRRK